MREWIAKNSSNRRTSGSRNMKKVFIKFILLFFLMTASSCKHYTGGPDALEKNEREILGFSDQENPRIKELQQVLNQNGFPAGVENGHLALSTRRAIREFQAAHDLEVTGYVDAKTLLALRRVQKIDPKEKKITASKKLPINKRVVSPNAAVDKKAVLPKIKAAVNKISSNVKPTTLQIQKALKKAGFDPGPIDGKLGAQTKQALIDFQTAHALKPDGVVGKATLKEMTPFLKLND